MARHPIFHARRNATLAGLLLLAGVAGCGDTPLPTEPDPCPADLAMMAGQWTGMAGDVRVTMQLVRTRVSRSLFGFAYMVDVMSGSGVADHPEDTRDVTFAVEFSCALKVISTAMVAHVSSPGAGTPVWSYYQVALLDVVSVSANQVVADLRPVPTTAGKPNPFDTDVRIVFERPPA